MVVTLAPAKGLAAANSHIKWPVACRIETIYEQDRTGLDQPLRNEVKSGKKLLKIVSFCNLTFLFCNFTHCFACMRHRKHVRVLNSNFYLTAIQNNIARPRCQSTAFSTYTDTIFG